MNADPINIIMADSERKSRELSKAVLSPEMQRFAAREAMFDELVEKLDFSTAFTSGWAMSEHKRNEISRLLDRARELQK